MSGVADTWGGGGWGGAFPVHFKLCHAGDLPGTSAGNQAPTLPWEKPEAAGLLHCKSPLVEHFGTLLSGG